MRDKFKSQGLSSPAAKTKAAKIYNAAHPSKPVGPHSDKPKYKFKFTKPKKRGM
jgi:hypothetical protein